MTVVDRAEIPLERVRAVSEKLCLDPVLFCGLITGEINADWNTKQKFSLYSSVEVGRAA